MIAEGNDVAWMQVQGSGFCDGLFWWQFGAWWMRFAYPTYPYINVVNALRLSNLPMFSRRVDKPAGRIHRSDVAQMGGAYKVPGKLAFPFNPLRGTNLSRT
ncbi:MAG: hypothetical protein BWZ07_03218 [Alphaproteobacteria bacterium ADurb.BinA280]|nr:MAG: hypothetical protein BWZ07_03218 [Alphaproteobacteria bacterium ADurb.BinA280]